MIKILILETENKISQKSNSYKISGWVKYYTDKNHGADGDGNRGYPKTFIDDCNIESIINVEKNIEIKSRIPTKVMEKIYYWFLDQI